MVPPAGQVPHAVGLMESILNVLPAFKGRNGGSRVNKTPGAPLVSTPGEYFMLFWDVFMLGIFVAATNAYGSFTVAKWTTMTVAEFKSFLAKLVAASIVASNVRFACVWVQVLKVQTVVLRCFTPVLYSSVRTHI